jgi:PAS domain-containing protein
MALFNRKTETVSSAPAIVAAAGSNVGASQIGNFIAYSASEMRARAMSLPTVTRSRDLICGTIGNLKLEMYREVWSENEREMSEIDLAPRSWIGRIDKSVTNNFILSWTADDLLFTGRAFWWIVERSADGYPLNFTRLPSNMVQTLDQQGGIFYGPSNQIQFNGMPLDSRDVIQFLSPIEGLNFTSRRAIETALRIEEARVRNASSSIPAGVLKITEGEPMSAEDLQQLAAQFNLARMTNQTAVISQGLTYTETSATPDRMLLIDSADYSAKDLSRAMGVPPYLVGVSTGSYSYQNASQSRIDLVTFGCLPLMNCIAETLSSDNVLPRGTKVRFDTSDFLAEDYMGGDVEEIEPMDSPDEVSDMPEMATQ